MASLEKGVKHGDYLPDVGCGQAECTRVLDCPYPPEHCPAVTAGGKVGRADRDAKILAALADGWSTSRVAAIFGVNHSTINRVVVRRPKRC